MGNIHAKSLDILIGQWLQSLREERGLSQEGLALQLKKGQSDIAKIEKGNKRITMVEILRWMNALGIPKQRIDELIKELLEQIQKE